MVVHLDNHKPVLIAFFGEYIREKFDILNNVIKLVIMQHIICSSHKNRKDGEWYYNVQLRWEYRYCNMKLKERQREREREREDVDNGE